MLDLHRSTISPEEAQTLARELRDAMAATEQRIAQAREDRIAAVLDRMETLLIRLVEIKEERIAIDKANAMILSGVMGGEKSEGPRHVEDYRESVDGTGFEVLVAGDWFPANAAETAEIHAMNQSRRRRR